MNTENSDLQTSKSIPSPKRQNLMLRIFWAASYEYLVNIGSKKLEREETDRPPDIMLRRDPNMVPVEKSLNSVPHH